MLHELRRLMLCEQIGLDASKLNGDVYDGDVMFSEDGPDILERFSALKVTRVKGNFHCTDCGIRSLKGCPEIIDGYFSCSRNCLTSLEYGPRVTQKDYYATNNHLISLKGCPDRVGDFRIEMNPLSSIEFLPKTVRCFTLDSKQYELFSGKVRMIRKRIKRVKCVYLCDHTSYRILWPLSYMSDTKWDLNA